jgi:hypothetical protein
MLFHHGRKGSDLASMSRCNKIT